MKLGLHSTSMKSLFIPSKMATSTVLHSWTLASGFIFSTTFVPVTEQEPSALDLRRLFKTSLDRSNGSPATLFTAKGQFQVALPAEAKRLGITGGSGA
nr:putative integron gene cassette protein [uncultured bacterium]